MGALRGLSWAAYSKATWATRLAGSACSVRELEQVTGMSQQLVSYHLRELRTAGLVAALVEGRSDRDLLCCSDLDDLVPLTGGLVLATRRAESGRVPGLRPA
jgi:DNA-binding transcriptional ArsR family regulator